MQLKLLRVSLAILQRARVIEEVWIGKVDPECISVEVRAADRSKIDD